MNVESSSDHAKKTHDCDRRGKYLIIGANIVVKSGW
jgi:hypothetical protein